MTTEEPMSVLDDQSRMQSVDRRSMLRLINDLPEQCETALGVGRGFPAEPLPEPPNVVLISGTGDSGFAADMAAEIISSEITVPVLTRHDGHTPLCVGEQALVIVVDYSGNSYAAMRSYREAKARGANVVCISGGGKLREIAAADGTAMVRIPAGQPSRTALGYLLIPIVSVVEKLGLVSAATEGLGNAVKLMKNVREMFRFETATARNIAKQIAESLSGNTPVICGTGGGSNLIAARWKNQIGANSKSPAMVCAFPDMAEGPIAAWEGPDDRVCSPKFIFLTKAKSKAGEPRLIMAAAGEALERFGGVIHVEMKGSTPAEQMLYGAYLGDYVSYYLALIYGVDPTRSESVDYIAQSVAEASKPAPAVLEPTDEEPAPEEETTEE